MIGWHPEQPRLGIFNGLGSSGALYGPGVAIRFVRHLSEGAEIDSKLDVARIKAREA